MTSRITDLREGLAAAMADQDREPDVTDANWDQLVAALSSKQATERVLSEVLAEISRAHSIHGRSVEDGTDSDRARILLCEAVEASQAVDAVVHAARYRRLLMDGAPGDVDGARATLEERRRDLRSEVVQVAAVAFRWLMAEQGGGAEVSDTRADIIMRDGPAAFGLDFNPNSTVATIHGAESAPLYFMRPAETYGEWAVHEVLTGGYRISHAPTGRAITGEPSRIPDLGLAVARIVAARIADAFDERGADLSTWTSDDGFIMEAIAAEELAR